MYIHISDLNAICNCDDLICKLSPTDFAHYKSFNRRSRATQFLVAHAIKNKLSNKFEYISIAHKGPLVIVAASNRPIGVDIEDMSILRDFKSMAAWMNFKNINSLDEFYRAFTRYESEYKMPTNVTAVPRYYKIGNYMICIISNDSEIIWRTQTSIPEQI